MEQRNVQQITMREAWILQRNQQTDQVARRRFIMATFKDMPDDDIVGNQNSNALGDDQPAVIAVTAKEYRENLEKEIASHETLIKLLDELISGEGDKLGVILDVTPVKPQPKAVEAMV